MTIHENQKPEVLLHIKTWHMAAIERNNRFNDKTAVKRSERIVSQIDEILGLS